MDQESKNLVIELLKSIDIKSSLIVNPNNRKMYEFGAFDALQTFALLINALPAPEITDAVDETKRENLMLILKRVAKDPELHSEDHNISYDDALKMIEEILS